MTSLAPKGGSGNIARTPHRSSWSKAADPAPVRCAKAERWTEGQAARREVFVIAQLVEGAGVEAVELSLQ